jgi:hypothetical protein
MKNFFLMIFLCLACSFSGFAQEAKMVDQKQVDLQLAMRKLWSDHVIWTRQFIVASVGKTGDVNAVTERLLKNQEDIGNSLVPYYGQDAAKSLTDLLRDHILIAADIVTAAIAKSDENVKAADKKWHENAEKIADFLSKANPNLSKNDLMSMLNNHMSLTSEEVMNRINQKWKEDIASFDKIFDQALKMGDALAGGIYKQFPDKK